MRNLVLLLDKHHDVDTTVPFLVGKIVTELFFLL